MYADDITLSSQKSISGELVWNIKSALYSKGLGTKKSKEASMVHKAADITGVIVGKQGVTPPNRQVKRLKELEEVASQQPNNEVLVREIRGRRAQLNQIASASSNPAAKK